MAAGVFVFSGGGSVATRPVDARDESADDAGENALGDDANGSVPASLPLGENDGVNAEDAGGGRGGMPTAVAAVAAALCGGTAAVIGGGGARGGGANAL